MPRTLADFLAREPELARLRRAIAAATPPFRRPRQTLQAAIELLTSRWHNGCAGWLTAAEGDRLAGELEAKAQALGILATATAEDDPDGRWLLVFRGGRYGEQRLRLQYTGPVAAALAWDTYLTSCARARLRLIAGGVR